MQTEADFIIAVLARPDDDAPRLVYADWLDEQGRGERAEFIRVGCEIATLEADDPRHGDEPCALCDAVPQPLDCRWAALRRRERELRANLGNPFVHIPLNVDCDWRRGFVEGITCTAETCLAFLDAILQAQPVREVTLTTWPLSTWQFGNLPPDWPLRRPSPENENRERLVALDALEHRWPSVKTWHLPPAEGGDHYGRQSNSAYMELVSYMSRILGDTHQ